MKALFVSLILPFALMLTACGKADTVWLDTPVVREAPFEPSTAVDENQRLNEQFNPQLEIIFVIDNSMSMEAHITKLSNNIDRFVDGFTKNTPFRYNVAVMSVYDHRRFKGEKFQAAHGGTDLEFDIGEFRTVKDSSGNEIPGKLFISSTDDDVAGKLKKTLKIGVQDLIGAGPEVEETFSPLAAAYGVGDIHQSAAVRNKQSSFFMGDDSYKVFFFVTDASDNSLISASDLYTSLLAKTANPSKIMGFGAISKNGCKRDPGKKNSELDDFLQLTRPNPNTQNVVSLCSNFGDRFASFGKEIRKQVLSQTIPLTKGIPDLNQVATSEVHSGSADADAECMKPVSERDPKTLVVCYGTQRIFLRTTKSGPRGYRFNPDTNRIRLDEGFQFDESQQGASLIAVYHPIHVESREKGNVKAWGQ